MPLPPRRRALRGAAALAGATLLLSFALAAAPARAQSLPVEQVQTDPTDVLAVHAGYEALLRQYRQLQPLPADTTGADTTGAASDLGLDGLVLDETQTRIGRDFYDAFYQQWEAPDGAQHFTVSVQEKPLRGQGILIAVRVNDELAFQARLQPRSDFDAIARQAVAYAHRRLQQAGSRVIL